MAGLRALVTAGGTREKLDDVRVITNLSRGRFGASIARALASQGVETTVLGSRAALELLEDDPQIATVRFDSFEDLARELDRLTAEPPDLLFMAAAVSDYVPIAQPGKIRSDAEELTITLRKTRKLLGGLRERCGVTTFLVGFKLLSGVTREVLVDTARRQVKGGRLNLTVANDLADFTERLHPVTLVTPEGGAIPIHGPRDDVAGNLVSFALERSAVLWSRSQPVAGLPPQGHPAAAARLLDLAQDARLLRAATDGNVSARGDGDAFWATPRNTDKAALTAGDLIRVEVDSGERTVRYWGPAARRPSIDSAVHGWLYERLADLSALVHTHFGLVFPTATTTFPYPCGTREEAEEIYHALAAAQATAPWAVHLVDHGDLIGLEQGGAARLAAEWASAREAYTAHLAEVGEDPGALRLAPILDEAHVVGVEATHADPAWTSVFLLPAARGSGLGERLVQRLDARGDTVAAHDRCEVARFYFERGYRLVERQGSLQLLEPPSRRDDLIAAASVCLFDPVSQRVLLGKRTRGLHVGRWTVPGGRVDEGESALEAATRELREETGLEVPTREPQAARVEVVGSTDGAQAFTVTCFTFRTLRADAPTPTEELDARWVDLAEALELPLAPSIGRILASLRQ